MADAAKLDAWLLNNCRNNKTTTVPTTVVLQYGPGPVRDKAILDKALDELQSLARIRVVQGGRRKTIHINPALVKEVAP